MFIHFGVALSDRLDRIIFRTIVHDQHFPVWVLDRPERLEAGERVIPPVSVQHYDGNSLPVARGRLDKIREWTNYTLACPLAVRTHAGQSPKRRAR